MKKPALTLDPHSRGKQRTVEVDGIDDGIRKAKNLEPGERVRPVVRGKPVGGTRIVLRVERINDGAVVRIVWRNGYAASQVPAAQHFVNVDRVGKPTKVRIAVVEK